MGVIAGGHLSLHLVYNKMESIKIKLESKPLSEDKKTIPYSMLKFNKIMIKRQSIKILKLKVALG